MKTQKLNLHDFKAVGTDELLNTKGGSSRWRGVKSPLENISPLASGRDGRGGAQGGCCCGGQWTSGDFMANGFAGDITSFMNNVYGTAQDIGSAALDTAIEWGDNFLDKVSPVRVITPPFPEYIDPNLMPPNNNFPTTVSSGNGCN